MRKKSVQLALFITVFLFNTVPVAAATVDVVGNGASSDNTANVSVSQTTTIFQSNTADVNNSVTVKPTTGSNTANENTGGNTGISTGDATGKVSANTDVNKNTASLACCSVGEFSTKISGNGADSENSINLDLSNSKTITDQKTLEIANNFKVDSSTGGNKADENTGGNTWIRTGDANVSITIGNVGNIDKIFIGTPNPVVPPVPGTNPIPVPPVVTTVSNPGSVLGALTSLPNTGFDLAPIAFASALMVLAGAVMRSQSEGIDDLLARVIGR